MNKTKNNIIDVVCVLGAIVFGLALIISYEGGDSIGKFLLIALPAVFVTSVFWYALKDRKEKL